jgi:hypothetical protein
VALAPVEAGREQCVALFRSERVSRLREAGQIHRERDDRLRGRVVQLAREPAPLFILRFEQAAREPLQPAPGLAQLRDVAHDRTGTDDPGAPIAQREKAQSHFDERVALRAADGLTALDPLTGAHAPLGLPRLRPQLRRREALRRAPDHLFRRPAKHGLRRLVPGDDGAVGIADDDGIATGFDRQRHMKKLLRALRDGGLEHQPRLPQLLAHGALLGHVGRATHITQQPARAVALHSHLPEDPHRAAVRSLVAILRFKGAPGAVRLLPLATHALAVSGVNGAQPARAHRLFRIQAGEFAPSRVHVDAEGVGVGAIDAHGRSLAHGAHPLPVRPMRIRRRSDAAIRRGSFLMPGLHTSKSYRTFSCKNHS